MSLEREASYLHLNQEGMVSFYLEFHYAASNDWEWERERDEGEKEMLKILTKY